ncbi:D-tagatose-1,6-bisphosphate aldolase subunit gatY [Leptolyngbya boryana NIES-2135]|jgi:tagatose 1,6-diphosphate aldolase GatY/KbaY|uniref:D-tagatose-1,6-bisphosphate aldolase subunit gatY n=1 Tax=Leptolyngbya boryana NIES-2135 TaxID=1973484 RepID=A0A1Z4JBS2_LEPBY|nr:MULTISPECIES: class II fructose-bisphosphate aldolase [Leptolyngbya]BAY54181.1 D-tagatose-1,6-bisphosphate aldolase subunit gatY [Leptolyngbya boryana NIES-2135]MBD2370244.1 class II fructose-bisphosphate aldolase [Leptolyngbya sp. FACHB-161]MBD2376652.1 class II fructose-bisphosphate aldolase [Leptolyngbya sp. FACHB-238]MBD2400924.1 class II fructose-bisphosphate aldolase [Leptolyngbya sp. FACHB-239]MBD2407506.1 class II fructose-bisphosphate aldolase [Leptolyngbya sp. FACHB-402]
MLTSTRELLETARRNIFAIGAFNVYNLEGVKAVINAAEISRSPAMLQLHPSALKYGSSPLVALCLEAAEAATVPISVHLDHSTSVKDIDRVLQDGVRSIMADGSPLPYEQNLEFTRNMTRLAHSYHAIVEAEIGRISGTEDGLTIAEKEAKMTDPQQAVEFVKATNVDALAVTIGNVHGEYKSPPRLDFPRLEQIRMLLDIPLVLHGASGLPAEMIARSIQLGVCKFNVNTEVRQAYMQALKDEICGQQEKDLLEVTGEAIAAMQDVILEKLELFGSVGKAHLHETPYATVLAAAAHRN